jgi:hypothetical protein
LSFDPSTTIASSMHWMLDKERRERVEKRHGPTSTFPSKQHPLRRCRGTTFGRLSERTKSQAFMCCQLRWNDAFYYHHTTVWMIGMIAWRTMSSLSHLTEHQKYTDQHSKSTRLEGRSCLTWDPLILSHGNGNKVFGQQELVYSVPLVRFVRWMASQNTHVEFQWQKST